MIRYYLDTHIPKAVAEQLRLRGIDVVRCEEVGLAEADDTEHLEYAAAQERTLVSHDADFRTLHSVWMGQGLAHAGIIVFNRRFQGDTGRLVRELFEYYELIRLGAATLQEDIFRTLIEVTE